MTASAIKRAALLLAASVACAPGASLGSDSITRVIRCAHGDSIQRQIDKRNPDKSLVLVIRGTCTEDVTVDRDDVTLAGEAPLASDKVIGTISVPGSRRVLVRNLAVSSPTGAGIEASDNAAVTIEDSKLDQNGTDGVSVRNGAQATLRRTSLSNNGLAGGPDTGRGIHATQNGSVDARDSTILNNRSDGVGVFNGSYVRLVANTIEGNGRIEAGEAGVNVGRSRVRAHGNIIRNNTGLAAVAVNNHSDYRTGTALNAVDFPDNEFAFERIEHAVGGGRLAIDVNNASYGDFRQVHIVGAVNAGRYSMVQVRGDDVGPSLQCSTITVPPGGGPVQISGRNGFLRLVSVNVTPPLFSIGAPNGQLEGSATCP
jgi:hypothetical protein